MSRRFKPNTDDDEEEENKDDDSNGEKENIKKRKASKLPLGGCDYKKGIKRAKKMVISPFSKFQKLFKGRTRSSSSTTNDNLSARTGNYYYCCMCLSKPQTLDTNSDEIDPSDPNVSYECLKSLIENNDFYSKECNTHFGD